jgi:hypothetical protein
VSEERPTKKQTPTYWLIVRYDNPSLAGHVMRTLRSVGFCDVSLRGDGGNILVVIRLGRKNQVSAAVQFSEIAERAWSSGAPAEVSAYRLGRWLQQGKYRKTEI